MTASDSFRIKDIASGHNHTNCIMYYTLIVKIFDTKEPHDEAYPTLVWPKGKCEVIIQDLEGQCKTMAFEMPKLQGTTTCTSHWASNGAQYSILKHQH